jgi:hypothetical protein
MFSRRFVVVLIGLVAMLPLCWEGARAGEVLHHIKLKPLSPELRRLVAESFPKYPQLRGYLFPEFTIYGRKPPKPEFSGAVFRANIQGELGAIILISGLGWCGSGGCTANLFLKRDGVWRLAGEAEMEGWEFIHVLRTTDDGFYRLDLGWTKECVPPAKSETDGIRIWKGTEYGRLHPCDEG